MQTNILITGMPRSGKSTLLNKVISDYKNKIGFLTNEVRENGERVGFEMETESGERTFLAHINFKSDLKVSKYFVNINNLNMIIPKISCFDSNQLLFLDEIGQMELFSNKFKELTIKYLDSLNICVATLSKIYSDDFIQKIKNRKDVFIIELTEKNREEKTKFVESLITKIKKAKIYVEQPERFSLKKKGVQIITDHGIRKLNIKETEWTCDCNFFKKNQVCSHVIALEEYLKKQNEH